MKFDAIILLVFIPLILADDLPKCCGQNQKLLEQNSRYNCEVNEIQRIQSNSVNLNFLNENKTGHCIDIYSDNIAKFFVQNSTSNVTFEAFVNVRYFPKCCPLGLQYNTTLHSCQKIIVNNQGEAFSTSYSFAKIGLPLCEIISDHIFENQQYVKINNDSTISLNGGRYVTSGKYCVDSTLDGKFLVRICEQNSKICNQIRCIHKCCPDGQSFQEGKIFNCTDNFNRGVNLYSHSKIENPNSQFALIHGFQEPMYPFYEDRYNFSIDKAGGLTIFVNKTQTSQYFQVSENVYCMEHQYRNRNGVKKGLYIVFFKSTQPKFEVKYAVTRWVKIASCIFLVLTIAVYVFLPKMRNLFGKILLNYCSATFLMFFFLAFSQFNPDGFNGTICIILGFCSIFSIISSFTWLNIMAIDIWVSFSTPRSTRRELQERESKLLLQYSFYGWVFPLFWVFFIVVLSKISTTPEPIRPYVGMNKCYLEDLETRPGNFAYILYIILPLLIQEIINIIVFIKTVQYCYKVKNDIERMNNSNVQSNFESTKKSMLLMVKLGVIMGISFSFEIISSIFDFEQNTFTATIEVIWDTINCLQGVFIFLIFIWKKQIKNAICRKIYLLLNKSSTTPIEMTEIERIGRTNRNN